MRMPCAPIQNVFTPYATLRPVKNARAETTLMQMNNTIARTRR